MIKSVYKLDSRIKDVLDIQNPTHYDDSFIGEVCYFAKSMSDFEDLESCSKGTLSDYIVDDHSEIRCFTANEFKCGDFYDYFIPEKLLNPVEKKYRAYTLKEFIGDIELGLGPWIRMRPVGTKKECKFLYTGYQETEAGEYICLGCFQFDFMSLFRNYEIYINGEWTPFGVLES